MSVYPLPSHNKALLQTAMRVVASPKDRHAADKMGAFGPWEAVLAGVFVTVYSNLPPSSKTVWCCMSNGEFEGKATALANTIESARVCATTDSRRTSKAPSHLEITLLAQRKRWKPVARGALRRESMLGYHLTTDEGRSAIFLPSVWEERADWSSEDLIRELSRKAGGSGVARVRSIPCFTISTFSSSFRDSGFVASFLNFDGVWDLGQTSGDSSTLHSLLEGAGHFYSGFAAGFRLAYSLAPSIADRGWAVAYENEGADARTFADALACRALLPEFGAKCLYRAISDFDPETTTDLPGYVLLLLEAGGQGRLAQRLCEQMLNSQETSGNFRGADASFANPQTLISIVRSSASPRVQSVALKFWGYYLRDNAREVRRALSNHREFAANWLLQAAASSLPLLVGSTEEVALIKSLVRDLLAPVCFRATESFLRSPESPSSSVTSCACSLEGLFSVFDRLAKAERRSLLETSRLVLQVWRNLQIRWAVGGFRYYVREPWYRTDVTSHVVSACLKMRSQDI